MEATQFTLHVLTYILQTCFSMLQKAVQQRVWSFSISPFGRKCYLNPSADRTSKLWILVKRYMLVHVDLLLE